MTSTVMTDPPAMHAELEDGRLRSELRNPRCPKCGRRTARSFFKPHEQHLSFECECGEVYKAK